MTKKLNKVIGWVGTSGISGTSGSSAKEEQKPVVEKKEDPPEEMLPEADRWEFVE